MLDLLRGDDGRIDATKTMIVIAVVFACVAMGAFTVAYLNGQAAKDRAAEDQRRLDMLNTLGGANTQQPTQNAAVPPQAQSDELRGVRYDTTSSASAAPATTSPKDSSPKASAPAPRTSPAAPAVDAATQRRLQMLNSLGSGK